ncbi:hypothetical protein P7C70_g7625, partial [Phenoliferia sp. Uapishka_3]
MAYNPYAANHPTSPPPFSPPPEGRQPRRGRDQQQPTITPIDHNPYHQQQQQDGQDFSHLAHGSGDYGGTYQPENYGGGAQYADPGYGQQHQSPPAFYSNDQHHQHDPYADPYQGGMPLHPLGTQDSLGQYDPPGADPFRGGEDEEEPGRPLLSPQGGGMSVGGFDPNVVGFQGAGIGEEEEENLVRYGKIPQRQPRRYKTVKRRSLLLGMEVKKWAWGANMMGMDRCQALPRKPREPLSLFRFPLWSGELELGSPASTFEPRALSNNTFP